MAQVLTIRTQESRQRLCGQPAQQRFQVDAGASPRTTGFWAAIHFWLTAPAHLKLALVGSPFGWFLGCGSLDFDNKQQIFEAGKAGLVLVNGKKVGKATAVRPGSSFVGRRFWWGNGRQGFRQVWDVVRFVSFSARRRQEKAGRLANLHVEKVFWWAGTAVCCALFWQGQRQFLAKRFGVGKSFGVCAAGWSVQVVRFVENL